MADAHLAPVLRHLRRLAGTCVTEDVPDSILLGRLVSHEDRAAFEALVRRHGPLVWRVCRRVLHREADAEDAFQATFLALAHQAASIRKPGSLASYLHGTAYRIARRAREDDERRRSAERERIPVTAADPTHEAVWRELGIILEEEVHALPEKLRVALLLCYWVGLTNEEAAHRLGWPCGTVKTRLAKARERLHVRLTRRGVTLPAGVAALLLAPSAGDAAVPPTLTAAIRAIYLGTIGVSPRVVALAEGGLKHLTMAKAKLGLVLLLAVGAGTAGLGALAYRQSAEEQPAAKPIALPNRSAPETKQAKPVKAEPDRTDRFGDPLPPGAVARLGSLRFHHGQQVYRVTLSPDGKWLVSTSSDGNRLWDAVTGRERPLRKELRQAAIFSTRDKLLAVEKRNLDLHFWDIAADKKVGGVLPAVQVGQLPVTIHLSWPAGFTSLGLSPDGRTLVVSNRGSGGRPVLRFCDVVRGQVGEPVALKLNDVSETRMAFSADSKTLVLQCNSSTVHVWDVPSRTEKLVSRSSTADYSGQIALSPDGTILATAPVPSKRIRLWDMRTLKELPSLLKQPEWFVGSVAFSPDGKQLVSSNVNSPILRLWDLAARKEVRQFQGKQVHVFLPVFSADGKYLAAVDGEGVTVWDVATGKFRHDFGHTYTIDSIHFSPDGRRLVSGAAYTDNLVRVWDPLTGEQTAQLRGHVSGIEVVAYAPDGKSIASGGQDGTVRLWDASNGREVSRLEAKDGMIYAMAFAPDGKTIATGGMRKAVHLWDVASGRELRSFDNPGKFILRLAFSPDGKLLATLGLNEKVILLWDVARGEPIRRLTGMAAGVPSLLFSPDGQTLAAASGSDGAVRLWDVHSGEERLTLAVPLQDGQDKGVFSVAFSPDGRSLAAGYGEKEHLVRLWELCSRRERARYEGHRGGITSLAFSPDGTLLASGGIDRIITVWDVTGQRTANLLSKGRLTSEELNALWNDLADADAHRAYRAMQRLLGAEEQTVALLKGRLHPAAAMEGEQRIPRLIADLDSEEFAVRQKAREELRKFGERAEPALREALKGKLTLEARKRVEELLEGVRESITSPENLRGLRAVEVLECIGTPAARRVLERLASGVVASRLTREAKASLERLSKRPTAP